MTDKNDFKREINKAIREKDIAETGGVFNGIGFERSKDIIDEAEVIYMPKGAHGNTRINKETGINEVFIVGGKSRYVSDGYHTFDELYQFRMLYNAVLFNMLATVEGFYVDGYDVHKSWKHSDGEPCFGGGWFIVVAYLDGKQISNHYKAEFWNLFNIPERPLADEWDGHTPQDVIERLTEFVKHG